MKVRLDIEIAELDKLFATVKKIPEDDELKPHLVKYLCIRSSGLIETALKLLVEDFHLKSCKSETANFVGNRINRVTNLDDKNLQSVLRWFSSEWVDKYSNERKEQYKSSLDSIVHNRHNIAHGQARAVSLSYLRMEQYFTDLKEVVKILQKIVKK